MFYLASRLVRPLTWLGLLEEEEGRRYRAIDTVRLRKSALFDCFFRFAPARTYIGSRAIN